ncbi:translation initiation factor IF-5A [Candidatus Woesearchaeota archaeon]|jgi:translation initiation factor 5A|nr:translation initiation factor IF-5A [Candidatus Woesearchaeota archaeon]MBT4368901.1 translation initiation factor IF-5A [Candidatus Woesearchaeota archaeon]MBT4712190.1 translation initiation factor IF-5A [Candidatus Woesearchaeota archaeon]MBT6639062.1 translation initiation factor IF-5A [Candidatus Woesearchaeota archaeon]MBT7134262.1 translation initiation factor IF-5A [Candidatus Woesearchaeota archaeon]
MGETKPVGIGTLQKGNYVVIEGAACKVFSVEISRPGKHGHAKVRLTGSGLIDGKKRVVVAPGHDHIDVPIVGKKGAQILSINGDKANVMDSETYETFDLDIPEELKESAVSGANIIYWTIMDNKVMKQVKE